MEIALGSENAALRKLSVITDPLADRYGKNEGTTFLTGLQALIRMMGNQARRDQGNGLKVGGFVTGYPGSPLGGMEGALTAAKSFLDPLHIRVQPGQNEELAASSLIGTQMIEEHPHSEYQGVVGYWYGKGPGVDRAGDAFKHGNFAGTSTHGAVVVLSGEDHEAKSSTVPYAQEFAFEHFGIPVLYPATVSEFITFGQHAVAMSRFSGCWVAMKLAGALCDGGETIDLANVDPKIVVPDCKIEGKPFKKKTNFRFFPVVNISSEHHLYYERHAAARAYAQANAIDRIVLQGDKDKVGIIAAGKAYSDMRHALLELGWTDEKLRDAGIRILKIGMLCPIETGIVKEFALGLSHVVVIEEKRDFIERQIGRAMCDLPSPPKITGKFDIDGKPVFPIEGGLDHDKVAEILGPLLARLTGDSAVGHDRLQEIASIKARKSSVSARRAPTYCSGCPHNVGTKLAPGQVAWGAPGCHVFAAIMPEPTRRIEAVTQYGGEGLPWIGLSPFSSRKHIIQNMGDGSLFHSSYLNIRYAIATKANITFKILYNGAIANTGGQPPVGQRTVSQLSQLLTIEGVKRIALIAKDRNRYKRGELSNIVEIHYPEDIENVQRDLEKVEGVTIVIYDGECANERRRQQKRGKAPKATEFTVINEDVCENCGNCGEVSSCMSLRKTPTEFGEKTFIHQSSCNQDLSCVKGECPSFVTVKTEVGNGVRRKTLPSIADLGNKQGQQFAGQFHICVPGIGGTGVITINAILAQAATLDGYKVTSFDQTGAAQKWGPVLSNLILTNEARPSAVNNIGIGRADLYLALDPLAASDSANLQRCTTKRTSAAINSSVLPTGEMIRNIRLKMPSDPLVNSILDVVDKDRSIVLDASAIAEEIFGDYMMTNMIVVGAAYEAGLLPISASSIESSITLNNVAKDANIAAFRAGRLAIVDPKRLLQSGEVGAHGLASRVDELRPQENPSRKLARDRIIAGLGALNPDLVERLKIRVDDLIDYQNERYAEKFANVVGRILAAERKLGEAAASQLRVSQAVIHNLHKVMAYKDEYEVARLLTQSVFRKRTAALFNEPVSLTFNLQPPLLRHFGMTRKVQFGEWFTPVLRLLSKMRVLRGTPFDIFGYASVRRSERNIVEWYITIVDEICASLDLSSITAAIALAELPQDIRGYEDIKLRSIETVKIQAQNLLLELRTPAPTALSA